MLKFNRLRSKRTQVLKRLLALQLGLVDHEGNEIPEDPTAPSGEGDNNDDGEDGNEDATG